MIRIDGLDISLVTRRLLRQRCFVTVSQDALIFPHETLRFNLDPSGALPDQILVEALTRTGLWSHLTSGNGGSNPPSGSESTIFDIVVSELPRFSFGQCQLFALSRALVRTNELRAMGMRPPLLLDEVTAAVDADTEAAIHDIVDDEFTSKGHTVIIVAHKVGMMTKYLRPDQDAVVWMSDGRLEKAVKVTARMNWENLGDDGDL
jgi:ABC-type multidrug transport system fused ATPase/permease subunit